MGSTISKSPIKVSTLQPSSTKQLFNPLDSFQSTKSTTSMLHDHKKNKPKISNVKELKRSNTQESYDVVYNENSIDLFEIEHQILKDVWKENFCCVIKKELQIDVLDVACGRGHWIRDMSNEFQTSHFTGIQAPPCNKVDLPHNNTVIIPMDIVNKLSYGKDSFDYVHMRCLDPNFTEDQWKIVITEMVRVTKPQGTVEIVVGGCECEDSGPIMKKVCDARHAFLESNSIKTDILKDLESLMKDTKEFASLEKQVRKIPIGKSSGKVGEM
ncbi:1702_t:CDS:2, partial [Dentiscutata erythropus]